jgi:hypothetical protein
MSLAWEEVRDLGSLTIRRTRVRKISDAMRFLFESSHVRIKHELAAYAPIAFHPKGRFCSVHRP